MIALGIESSCDETAVALVNSDKKVLAHALATQLEIHQLYGGVVPELAARSHLEVLYPLLTAAFNSANLKLQDVDCIAATAGPGLIGGVLVGMVAAKALAAASDKPFVAINHLEGHALSPRLEHDISFPFLLLLLSGGHCQIIDVTGVGRYEILGQTIDDAIGEAFDKVAKMLGLGYPGGPAIEKWAKQGDENAFVLPTPLLHADNCDFSFSGIKTAVKRLIDAEPLLTPEIIANIAASLQKTIADVLYYKTQKALEKCRRNTLVIAGGVAANQYLRKRLANLGVAIFAPSLPLCTDNAMMIAWAAIERKGQASPLNFVPRSRWPLTDIEPV